jgi:hypothetical protein
MLFLLQVDDDTTLGQAESTRVMGIGIGIFALIFVGFFSLFVCMLGSVSRRPG